MRLTFATQKEAQVVADRIYADMAAAGKLEPLTSAWAIPYQDRDEKGQPFDTLWHVSVNTRCRNFLTPAEVACFPEWN